MLKKIFVSISIAVMIGMASWGARKLWHSWQADWDKAVTDLSNVTPPVNQLASANAAPQAPEAEPLIITVDPATVTTQLEFDPAGKYLADWAQPDSTEIVVNAAYFNDDFSPAGLLIVDGKIIGHHLFDQTKSGLLVIQDGRLSIRDLQRTPITDDEQFDDAVQSYPFLIKNGQPAIAQDSELQDRRTAIGLDTAGTIYVISETNAAVSLYELMKKLLASNIPFTDVLNLDGGASTGLSANWGKHHITDNSYVPIPSVLRLTTL